jgi:hypothetical protein
MTNDNIKSFPALTRQEVYAFLKTQRPDVSLESWEKVDVILVLQWLLPAYAQHVHRSSDSSKGAK